MLILFEGAEPKVKAARNLKRENIADAVSQLSDSILDKVVRSRKPLIVSDALHDKEFSASSSVVGLNLCSVMCVPLLSQGNLIGVIYVGNDNIVNLFTQEHLETLIIFAAQASLLLTNAMLVNDLRVDNKVLSERIEQMCYGSIIGACDAMKDIYRKIDKVAATDVSVLVQGETGTGKELIARELHNRSPRVKKPFVTLNCGAIPESLLESELFGHVKGAFTGAVQTKPGKFHLADTGTIFLDEIGEMPLNLQVKLLRVLQEKTVTRVGDTKPERLDLRILAATNRNLEEEVKAGRFREDLFYRLNVVTLHLPPLRKRGDDINLIAHYLLQRFTQEFGVGARSFSKDSLIAMKKYAWPGNIRQLENRIKKAVILSDRAVIEPTDLDLQPEDLEEILPLNEAKERFQRRYINEVLARNNGNRTKTAKDLGVDPRTIFRHLEKEGGASFDEEE
jgi:transcriptional regulator with GAF, ATPase, and Fis domain